ncbi:MAG: NADH-quinone oxidoreductase subunit N, partial [Myxococcota bacterium]|nr:NADH-quinone oxidoreductase subunit N [Myxococcota bacterium]
FAADLAQVRDDKGGLGALTAVGLSAVFVLSWWTPLGQAFDGVYVQDAFTLFMQRLFLGAGALAAVSSMDRGARNFPGRLGEYYILLLSSILGMMVLAGARDLLLLLVAFELMSLPLVALAAIEKQSKEGVEGALKLFLTSAISSAVTIYGLSFLVGELGTTRITEIARLTHSAESVSALVSMGAVLVLAGVGFKIGAVPFHMWVPDTYQGAPTPFVAFLSVAPKAAGFAALTRLYLEGLGGLQDTWAPVLVLVCVVTMGAGNLLALPQEHVKRLLGFSGVAHIGLLLLGFAVATPHGMAAVLFYLTAYLFTNMGAFFVVEVVAGQVGTDDDDGGQITAWNGLGRRSPFLALAMLVFLLSLGGIPFVAGFWAKLFLF